jgi:hypothetical protein
MLPLDAITLYRRAAFRSEPDQRLQNIDQAAEFVRQRGFVYFWPINGAPLPSLWVATAGDRPVPDNHDDPGNITWTWKDQSLGGDRWYYAKLLRKKATLVAFDLLPFFYALSENYGSPEEDYLTVYEQGRLSVEAKTIYETLLEKGQMTTIELRKACRMSSAGSNSSFDKALTDLQADFKIVPVGVGDAGGWHYVFIYDCVHRCYPDLPEQARPISEPEARRALAAAYFTSLGGAPLRDLIKLFGWRPPAAQAAVDALAQSGLLRCDVEVEGQKDGWIVLRSIVS